MGLPKHIDEQQHHGLKIMQERTHSLGGEFDISQNTPKGTLVRIWFYLNFMRTRNNMVLKIFTAANPARLLLVDDHPMLRRGLADLLSLEKDVQVIAEANHGMEALDILNQEIVDLVILDHTMPILNGIETLKKIRELGIQTKVLLFTVSDNSKDVQDALHLGVDGYLLKDMEPEQIITDIRKILCGELVISQVLHRF